MTLFPHNPDSTICYIGLTDGSVAEMTETQFNQIMAGEEIKGITKEMFIPRPINHYVQVTHDADQRPDRQDSPRNP